LSTGTLPRTSTSSWPRTVATLRPERRRAGGPPRPRHEKTRSPNEVARGMAEMACSVCRVSPRSGAGWMGRVDYFALCLGAGEMGKGSTSRERGWDHAGRPAVLTGRHHHCPSTGSGTLSRSGEWCFATQLAVVGCPGRVRLTRARRSGHRRRRNQRPPRKLD